MQRIFEKFGPIFAAVACFCALYFEREIVLDLFDRHQLQTDGLYTAIFDWSAIQTGFLFGVYGFMASKRDGFIGEIRETYAMAWFLSYIKRATFIGFILTFSSIPLIIISPKVGVEHNQSFVWVAGWFSLFIWAFLAFARVAYIFGLMARTKDKEDLGA